MIKVLYLFNKTKRRSIIDVHLGREPDNHFFGMLRLKNYGVQADYIEIEQFFPSAVVSFLRKYVLNIHFVHLPLFFNIFKYDIVFTSTAFVLLFVKAIFGIRKPKWVMFDFNLEEIIGDRKTFRRRLFYYAVSKCDGIITISKSAQEAMKQMFPRIEKNIKFLHLGTDTDFFKPSGEPELDFILCPGRDPGRDYVTLFEAVKDLPIEVKVTAKTQHLEKAGIAPSNIHQYDFTHLELREEYARAKIILIPLKMTSSSNNAMGCSTLVEAMAMGKAVIVTDTSTMRSYIKNGENGILVPPGDSLTMRKAIERLLADEPERRRLGENARNFAVEECSAEKFAERLAIYFRKL